MVSFYINIANIPILAARGGGINGDCARQSIGGRPRRRRSAFAWGLLM